MFLSVMASDIDEIGDRLRRTREAMRLTQASWCRLVGIEQQAWNNYERGARRISIDQALKVCRATGVSLDWIYRGIAAGLPVNLATSLQEQERGRRR
jgi:transcriptional regulator with XRE-family HTH domain